MDFSDTPSLYSFPSVYVSDEDFKLFHSIDRKLFARLVVGLGRDPSESLQLMAFWLWLENAGNDMFLVKKVLSLPAQLVSEVAEETVLCLKCVKNENFPFMEVDLALLPNLVRKNGLTSPVYLHHNRVAVMRGLKKMVTKVCFRAFEDILLHFAPQTPAVSAPGKVGSTGEPSWNNAVPEGPHPPFYHAPATQFYPNSPYPSSLGQMSYPPAVVSADYAPLVPRPKAGSPPHAAAAEQRPLPPQMNTEMLEMFNRSMRIAAAEDVHPDDRTIFLTFSKGYPISEQEVKDFFFRKFGDSIETIYMQEVASGEQVLYARLVARSLAALEAIVVGGKAKYNINGKHVWARKYVKKQNPKALASSPSSPSSPAAAPSSSKP
ncbi:PREDICTED: uncharacterized protein LOC109188014 [Ipomoea nil]|uniref:uncharacterized protein LOC109188014 n=1 Tax=Ipomoea nil TaxID=35883 RepID=UPI00090093C8|nr:PREDICTED: uncharacterized protein LOC109188014 [Ipomoea nil]